MFKNAFGDCIERFEGMIAVARSKIVKMNNRLPQAAPAAASFTTSFGNAGFIEVEFSSFEGVTASDLKVLTTRTVLNALSQSSRPERLGNPSRLCGRSPMFETTCHILIIEANPIVGDFESDNILMGIRPSFLFGIVQIKHGLLLFSQNLNLLSSRGQWWCRILRSHGMELTIASRKSGSSPLVTGSWKYCEAAPPDWFAFSFGFFRPFASKFDFPRQQARRQSVAIQAEVFFHGNAFTIGRST